MYADGSSYRIRDQVPIRLLLSAAALMPCRQLAKLAATREPGSQRKHGSPKLDDN
jgi:hypothetical protein